MKCPKCGSSFKIIEDDEKEQIILTEFQKLVVECEPEINKPVFILTGVGCGKTVAFNERAKVKNFLYHTESRLFARNVHKECPIINCGSCVGGFNEIVFEVGVVGYKNKILDLIKRKKVIICTNPIDFVNHFANHLKGEYTVISGYNVKDNPHLIKDCSDYEECLKGLHWKDREKLYEAKWR